ncbi:cell wall anchor protein [Streptococcus sp. HMSC10A01]|uniref:Cna B-type domain-containing protein n=1 Tax=Streptococcus sp. HMSC10A01 TaxID=1581076 RepID=UPI0008A39344|nr:Cna B-type domain-containing protein [Streptococcus sp. HMSC10A01]OFU69669.1 cell wall anchor protein [Streptococcus sp. HMSC10A01]
MKFKAWLLFFLLPVLFLLDMNVFAETAQAQNLKNAITEIKIWDHANGREATKVNGAYNLVQGGNYRYELTFDLSAYDNRLNDGDTFTFTVPNGATIANGTTFNLTDNETQVQLGVAKLQSNGSGKGGVITVTLQNLSEYQAKTTSSGVKGSFFFDFQATKVGAEQDWKYNPEETQGTMSHKVTINERKQSGFSTAGENFAKIGGVIAKKPYNSAILGKSGDYSHNWTVRINTQQKTYNSPIVIKDSIPDDSAPMQFVPEQLVLRQGEYTQSLSSIANSVILKEGQDYTITYNETYTEFTLTILNPSNHAFMLNYMTTSPADGSLVSNTVQMEVDNQTLPFRDDRPTNKAPTIERSSRITEGGVITANISNSLVIYKQDSKTGKMLEGAVFKVTTPSGEEIILPPTDANGRVSTQAFSDAEIKKGQFTVEEVTAPEGYVLDNKPIKVTIKAEGAVRTIKNELDPNASKTLTIKKVWKDESNQDGKRPASIAVDIYADGQKLANKTLTVTGGSTDAEWTAQATDLPIFDASGKKITYTIGEDQVEGYEAPVVDQDNLTITNSRTPEKISMKASKKWEDGENQDGKRPANVVVKLYKEVGGQKSEVANRTLTEADQWATEFTDLNKYENGQEVVYSLEEKATADYQSQVTGNATEGFVVTNTHQPETTTVSGQKKWDDANNQDGKRPTSVKIKIMNGDKVVDEQEVTSANEWKYESKSLPKYAAGQEIVYTVSEEAVAGYTSKVEGYNVTNSYTPETIKISGQKKWDDADNQDGKRPTSVKIKIMNGDKVVDEQEVTSANEWKYESKSLPKYAAGQEIVYTVNEEAVAGYTSKVDGYNITNSYTPETVKISGQKKWDDADNQDGKRPASVKVKILNGDTVVDEQNVTSANDWKYESKALPKYAAGQEIAYTVTEEAVAGYTAKVEGYNITNSYTPETTTVSGSKTWDDSDNQDGKRPASITVNLLADGQKINSQTVGEAEGWSYNFTGLPVYKDGQRITYTVTEDAVPGYSTNLNGYNITNSYTPEKTEISVSKSWNDSENQDGKRPSKIKIKLMKTVGGVKAEVASKEVTAADQWKTKFEDLPVYENGQKIVYSIEEDGVAGYTTEIKDFTVTNSYTPEMVKISGQKVWDDADNQDGKRPASVKIKVKNGDAVVDEFEVTAATDWKFTSKELPKYAAGQEIAYTVTEEAVTDYQTKIDNFTITNSYTPQSTEYAVTKVWDDASNQDGKRPASITVQLYRSVNGQEPVVVAGKTLTLTADNQVAANTWKASFTNLPQFDKGQLITYTVKEDDATVAILKEKGYSPKVEGQILTNSYTPEQVKVSGQKVWDDADDQDGKRPASITVKVMDGSTIVDTLEVTANSGWKFESKNLPKYRDGQEIVYTLSEDAVTQYETKIDNFTITNSYTPETIKISGQKVWDDANNQDGKRPTSIKVKILDGDKVVDELEVTEATGWKFESKALPKNNKGKKITYTVVEEVTVEGYSSHLEQASDGSYILTNSYKPTKKEGTDSKDSKDPKGSAGKLSTQASKGAGKALPRTGQDDSLFVSVLGMLTTLLAGVLWMSKRKCN